MSRTAQPHSRSRRRFAAALACAAVAGTIGAGGVGARAQTAACPPLATARIDNGAKLALAPPGAARPLAILAIGSSSTEGIGASSPDRAYPARLAEELRGRGGLAARVRNAGVGGETADVTVARLKAALATGWPQLVIWQVGTNDALKGVDETRFRTTVEAGVEAAREAATPIILLDPQYIQRAAVDPRYQRFVDMVEDVGERDHVPVFSRYAEMKRLAATPGVGLAAWLSPDGLHMNDLGYACVANGLARMIEDAAKVTTAMRERGADPKAPGPAPAEDRRAFQTRAAHGPH